MSLRASTSIPPSLACSGLMYAGVPMNCSNAVKSVFSVSLPCVAFATPNYLIQEVVRKDVPWRKDVVNGQIPIENGHAVPPTAPGLGIDINEAEADKHPWQPEVTMDVFRRDGSVADW